MESDETAEIIENSVEINNEKADSGLLDLKIEDNNAIVSTGYELAEKGFGKDYLQDSNNKIIIDLSKLNINAANGTLEISIVYNDEAITKTSSDVKVPEVIEVELNQTEAITIPENISISLIKNIPDLIIKKNSFAGIVLSDYFSGAESYASVETENLTIEISANAAKITPDIDFEGIMTSKFIAILGNESTESNVFSIIVSANNISIKTIQHEAKINELVKWTKQIKLDEPENISVQIPNQAVNISIKKIEQVEEAQTTENISQNFQTEIAEENKTQEITSNVSITAMSITGKVSSEIDLKKETRFSKFLKKLFGITGFVTGNITEEQVAELGILEYLEVNLTENTTNYEIEYYTEAPHVVEEDINIGKRVMISGPENIVYENILAYTEIPENIKNENNKSIGLYHIQNDNNSIIREKIDYNAYDLNNNSFIDYIEWIVPHLSNQTYEIILITKAEHLDSNRSFISDIYEQVKELDGIWSEPIYDNEYVRVTFEQNLTNQNDITIYARAANITSENESSENETGFAQIEVLRKDDNSVIAVFDNIADENWYKIYLTNLSENESYDVFDLRILGDLNSTGVEFDYIVDPDIIPQINFTDPTPYSGIITNNNSLKINISVYEDNNLSDFIFNWDGTNYTIFNNSLFVIYNFENYSSLGEHITNAADLSITETGNNAYLNKTILNTTGCLFGNCMTFNGTTSWIDPGSPSPGIFHNAIQIHTIEVWVKANQPEKTRAQTIVEEGGGTHGICIAINNSNIYFSTNVNTDLNITSFSFTDTGWHYIAGTYNQTNTSLYIDGVLVNSSYRAAANVPAHSGGPGIGASFGDDACRFYLAGVNTGSYFNGSLDEIKIWNRSLSETEINFSYHSYLQKYNLTQWYYYKNISKLNNATYTYFGWASDNSSNSNITETRTYTISNLVPQINFTNPTPANASSQSITSVPINISITETNIADFIFNWNSTNYTFYNSSLSLMFNFNNVSDLGENDSLFTDLSGNGNNGVIDGRCIGTETSCTGLTEVQCGATANDPQYGCFWEAATCKGAATACTSVSDANCLNQLGCNLGSVVNSSGKYGNAILFNGFSNRLNITNPNKIPSGTSARTISFWFNTNSFGTATDYTILSMCDSSCSAGEALHIHPEDNAVAVSFNSHRIITPKNNLSINVWYYVSVVVLPGATTTNHVNIYINGINQTFSAETGSAQTLNTQTSLFRLGLLSTSMANYYNGTIDELAIWNRSLSSEEINFSYYSNLQKYNSSQWYYYSNITNVSAGNYTYFGWVNNVIGNSNITELRTLNIFSANAAPDNPVVYINSTDFSNKTNQDLNCLANITDPNADSLGVTVQWYKNNASNLTISYNNSYANGTLFIASLNNANTTKGENWSCGMLLYDATVYSSWINSSNLKILNSAPNISLINPANGNLTTDRKPEFTWIGGDNDTADILTYDVNITGWYGGGGKVSSCNDYVAKETQGSTATYTPGIPVKCLVDNNNHINWSVRAYDGEEYSEWAVIRNISIQSSLSINLTVANVSFGNINISDSANTTTGSPPAFALKNDGNAETNISVNSSALFSSVSHPSSNFQYKIGNLTSDCFVGSGTQTTWANTPLTLTTAINRLNFTAGYQNVCDNVSVDILVEVPVNEEPGNKSSLITFIASLGEPGFPPD